MRHATAHIVEVYNYSTKNGEGSLFKRYVIKGSNNYRRSFKLTGLKPGTAKHYTVHLIRTDSSGTEYEYIDNQYWTLKSASFKTPLLSVKISLIVFIVNSPLFILRDYN